MKEKRKARNAFYTILEKQKGFGESESRDTHRRRGPRRNPFPGESACLEKGLIEERARREAKELKKNPI